MEVTKDQEELSHLRLSKAIVEITALLIQL